MEKVITVALLFSVAASTGALGVTASSRPDWAYADPPPPSSVSTPPVRDDGKLLSLPGSDKKFTLNKIRGLSEADTTVRVAPADWYPSDHPAMPKIVAEGDNARKIIACSLCHYPNGKGRSENASPGGLSNEYIMRQLYDMRNNLRHSADPNKANAQLMVGFAKAMTPNEIQAASAYFSSIPWTPWIRVVETKAVPKTRSAGGLWIPLEGKAAGSEPIGNRIIEIPMNAEHTEALRDPHSGFIAYVPVGAIEKGKRIVTIGDGARVACGVCHGGNLHGVGPIPSIAARSPSYIARQLYDIQQGARHGTMTSLMKPIVAKLSGDDILNVAAYLASLPARPGIDDVQTSSGGGNPLTRLMTIIGRWFSQL